VSNINKKIKKRELTPVPSTVRSSAPEKIRAAFLPLSKAPMSVLLLKRVRVKVRFTS